MLLSSTATIHSFLLLLLLLLFSSADRAQPTTVCRIKDHCYIPCANDTCVRTFAVVALLSLSTKREPTTEWHREPHTTTTVCEIEDHGIIP